MLFSMRNDFLLSHENSMLISHFVLRTERQTEVSGGLKHY